MKVSYHAVIFMISIGTYRNSNYELFQIMKTHCLFDNNGKIALML